LYRIGKERRTDGKGSGKKERKVLGTKRAESERNLGQQDTNP
jgi:hypothetical protein